MSKYVKRFISHTDYEDWTTGSTYITPYVATCDTPQEVHFMPYDLSDRYLTFLALENSTFTFNGTTAENTLEYSTDNGNTWTSIASGASTPTVQSGKTIMWKGSCIAGPSNTGIGTFISNGSFEAYGNPMSLVIDSGFESINTLSTAYQFRSLFFGCTGLTLADRLSLPFTAVSPYCYYKMFFGCTNLITPPKLPATSLAEGCYQEMFYNCIKIETAPSLPATTLKERCYMSMFRDCRAMKIPPKLPALTVPSLAYAYMFYSCIRLIKTPQLPATTFGQQCYASMFYNSSVLPDCTNIDFSNETVVRSGVMMELFSGTKVTDADLEEILPKNQAGKYCLPVMNIGNAAYYSMFQDCGQLVTPPELPATAVTSSCYEQMFNRCVKLESAPALPATTLATKCYYAMFQECNKLTNAPELPALTLASICYMLMFNGCTSLSYIKALFTTEPGESYTQNWVNNVSASGTFVKNASAQWNVSGADGIPENWTIQTA